MATPEQEEQMRELARLIEESLDLIYGEKMAFFLNVGRFEQQDGVSDYISNADRETAMSWMLETVERFVNKTDIPASEGSA